MEELGRCSELGGRVKPVVRSLVEAGIAELEGDVLLAPEGIRVLAALQAMREGVDIGSVSRRLTWRDFESLTASVMEGSGFKIWRGFRVHKVLEVDVIGVDTGFALVIDCKHWMLYSPSKLREAGFRQRMRVRRLFELGVADGLKFTEALPVLVILQRAGGLEAGGSCIVPVSGLREFITIARGFEGCRGLMLRG